MDLRQVEYFLAVVDHGGVTRAAEALFVAQPSVSQALRVLERELAAELFDRGGRRLVLTEAGRSFVGPARRLLDDARLAKAAASRVGELRGGRVTIAALATLAVDPLPALAGEFHRRHPGVLISVTDPGSPDDVGTEVKRGNCELGLTELPVTGVEQRGLGSQEIVLAVPAAFAAGLPDPVPLSAAASLPLVMGLADATIRKLIPDTLHPVVECAHPEGVRQLVAHGAGAAFLPRTLAERELPGVPLLATEPAIRLEIGLIFRAGPLSPAAAAFIELA
ncbi:LysR family transcriptional regulator [Saccharothrix sp. AJ9571]|nr:LysR family transcriptional regulator [Saccharothrix sp. AJ9571]